MKNASSAVDGDRQAEFPDDDLNPLLPAHVDRHLPEWSADRLGAGRVAVPAERSRERLVRIVADSESQTVPPGEVHRPRVLRPLCPSVALSRPAAPPPRIARSDTVHAVRGTSRRRGNGIRRLDSERTVSSTVSDEKSQAGRLKPVIRQETHAAAAAGVDHMDQRHLHASNCSSTCAVGPQLPLFRRHFMPVAAI